MGTLKWGSIRTKLNPGNPAPPRMTAGPIEAVAALPWVVAGCARSEPVSVSSAGPAASCSRPCIELSCLRGLCCGRLCRNFRQCRDELLDVRCPQSCDAVITSSGGKLAIAAGCDVPETSGAAQWVDDRVQIRERRQSGFLPRLVDDHKDQPKPAQPSLFRQFQSAVRAGPGKPLRWDRRLRSHREPTSCFRWVRHCLSARRGGRRRCCSLRRCQSSRPPLQQTHLPVQASSLSRRPRRPPYPMRHIRPAADRQGSARHRPDWIRRLRSTRRC